MLFCEKNHATYQILEIDFQPPKKTECTRRVIPNLERPRFSHYKQTTMQDAGTKEGRDDLYGIFVLRSCIDHGSRDKNEEQVSGTKEPWF